MIIGAHFLLYSKNPEADRTFFQEVLRFPSVDAGDGWLIFKLPATEAAIHPGDGNFTQGHAGHALLGSVLYLMCDDLTAYLPLLEAQGVKHSSITQAPWGSAATISLPSGGEIGLYQPTHPTALAL